MADVVAPGFQDLSFRAMGSRCRLVVNGGPDDLAQVMIGRIEELESRWSRFRSDSDVSQLNRASGYPVIVGDDVLRLVVHAKAAWELTDGWFDPLLLGEIEALGYDRDHRLLDVIAPDAPIGELLLDPDVEPAERLSPMHGLVVDEALSMVALPAGVGFDPGGLGKGLAADVVVDEALRAGAGSVFVDLGGDVRLGGTWFGSHAWPVLVGHPNDPERVFAELAVTGGGLATSGRRRRRWRTTRGEAHHLLDPHTGRPSNSELVMVTVNAGSAWYAEVLAKAALLAGPVAGRQLIERTDTTALFVDVHGAVGTVGGLQATRLEP